MTMRFDEDPSCTGILLFAKNEIHHRTLLGADYPKASERRPAVQAAQRSQRTRADKRRGLARKGDADITAEPSCAVSRQPVYQRARVVR